MKKSIILSLVAACIFSSAVQAGAGDVGDVHKIGAASFSGGAVTSAITLPVGACPSPSLSITGHTGTGIYYVDEATEEAIGFCIHGVKAGFLGFAPTTSANGQGNTVFGSQAGLVLDLSGVGAALNNTIIGGEAGNKLTTGQQNTYLGSRAGHENVTANQQTFLGQGAGYSDVAADDVMVGFHAGLDLTNGGTSTCLGTQACEGHTTGSVGDSTAASITAVGFQAGRLVTSASQSVFVGTASGDAVTTATGNVFVGHDSGGQVTTAGSNTIVGSAAFNGAVGTSAVQNVAVGTNTMQATTLPQNVAVGYAACISCTSAQDNTVVGWEAGFVGTALTTGDQNTLIGSSAQPGSAAAANRSVVGFNAIGTADNSVKLGNTSVTTLNIGNGHVEHFVTPSSVTTGTCTSESGTGTEAWGTVTATCTAQTWIVAFTTTYGTAPFCLVDPMNGAAGAAEASLAYTTSTTALTVTVTTATTAGIWAYHCSE